MARRQILRQRLGKIFGTSRQRGEERRRRWFRMFPRNLPLAHWEDSPIVTGLVKLFKRLRGESETRRRVLAAATSSRTIGILEPLEQRRLLAFSYIDEPGDYSITGGWAGDWCVDVDQGTSGTLDAGDTVTWQKDTGSEVTGLTFGTDAFGTIQAAIDAASSGDTVNVAAGTYNETITFDAAFSKDNLTISGDPGSRPAVTGGVNFQNTGDFSGLTIENLHLTGSGGGGANRIINMGNLGEVDDFTLDNCVVDGEDVPGRMGFYGENLGGSFVITNTQFKDILYWSLLDVNGNSPDGTSDRAFTSITFSGNTIQDSDGAVSLRGRTGAERTPVVNVNDNTWSNINNNGGSPTDAWAAVEVNHAVQLNMYRNTIDDVAENSWGEGEALQIWDVGTVDIQNNTFTNNHIGIYIFGTASNYPVPAGSITNNHFSGNSTNIKTDGNLPAGTLDASGNWWGTNDGVSIPASFADLGSAAVDYTPWLDVGTDTEPGTPGFQGDLSYLHVDDDSPQTGSTGRIQEGVDLVSGSTVQIEPGTYNESIVFDSAFDKDGVTITGVSGSEAEVTGGVRFLNAGGTNIEDLAIENLIISGVATDGNGVIDMDNGGIVTNLRMDNVTVDGSDVSGRNGLLGQNLAGSLSITNSEFKDILGWAVLDSNSGSGDGSADQPLTSVTFSDNYIHDVNGSIAFRGHATTKTGTATIAGNQFENIGGNNGQTGEHWAAVELNHTVEANIYDNLIQRVAEGLWGEGQALQLWDIDTVDIHDNRLIDNFQGIFVYGGSAGGTYGGPYAVPGGSIYDNAISGNTQYGISVDATATGGPLNAENNWWGDASGPSGEGSGTGDPVSANVDYDPWIGQSGDPDNGVVDPDIEAWLFEEIVADAPQTGDTVSTTVDPTELDGFIDLVEGLPDQAASVTIEVNLSDGTYSGLDLEVPENVTLVLDGQDGSVVIQGNTPALTVNGTVETRDGVTFDQATDDVTILVKNGGQLTLTDCVVNESSAGTQAAIQVLSGGSIDLSSDDNTLNVVGTGLLLDYQVSGALEIEGNTLTVDGGAFADNFAIEDAITHALDDASYGLVTWVADNLYVTTSTLGIQRGIDAASNGDTVNVEGGTYNESVQVDKAVTLLGEPTITGSLTVGAVATLSPGFSPGTISSGDLTLAGPGTVGTSSFSVGPWQRISTPTVNERSIEAIQGENAVLFHMALPDAVDSLQHLWAPGHASNPGTTLYMKWGSNSHPGGSDQYDGQAMTMQNVEWPSLNGQQVYMQQQAPGSERFYLWADASYTTPIAPTSAEYTVTGGYLGDPDAGELVWGHVTLPSPGYDVVGHATYTWDGATLMLNAPTEASGLEWSYTIPAHDEPGADIMDIQHMWKPGSTYGSGNSTSTLRIKGPLDIADGTQATIFDCDWDSLNGVDVYMQREAAGWYYLWGNAGYTVPIDATETNADLYLPGSLAGRLVDGVTHVPESTETGPVYHDPTVLNNGGGQLEAYFSPVGEDDSSEVTGLMRATSADGGLTWTVDSLIDNDLEKGTVELPGSNLAAFGTLSHMWNAGGGVYPPKAAVQIKWWVAGGGGDGTSYNGHPVTLVGASPAELNGHWYLQYVGPEYYELYANYDGTPGVYPSDGTFSDPLITSDPAGTYYGQGNGNLVDGHVSSTYPGSGAVAVTEVSGQRRLYATDSNVNLELFTATAGHNGPFTNQGIVIAGDGSTGNPAIASLARSGDLFQGPIGEPLLLYVDGNGDEANTGSVGLAKLSADGTAIEFQEADLATMAGITGMTTLEEATINNISFAGTQMTALLMVVGSPDGASENHDVYYAPISVDFLSGPSTLAVELDGATAGTEYDQVSVTGTVDVTDAALDLTLNYVPFPGTEFTIVDNDGDSDAVTGEFDGFADDATFNLTDTVSGAEIPFTIDYQGGDGNDIVLTVVRPDTVYVDDNFANPTRGEDPDGAGPAEIFGYDSFASLEDGIFAVAAGGTVSVLAGTYVPDGSLSGTVSLSQLGDATVDIKIPTEKSNITITGESGTTIDMSSRPDGSGAEKRLFGIDGPGFTLQNLTIVNPSYAVVAGVVDSWDDRQPYAEDLRVFNVTVDYEDNGGLPTAEDRGLIFANVSVYDHNNPGFDIVHATGVEVKDSVIDSSGTGVPSAQGAINLWGHLDGAIVQGNTISNYADAIISNNFGGGSTEFDSKNLEILDNDITLATDIAGWFEGGIVLAGVQGATIEGNTITTASGVSEVAGIYVASRNIDQTDGITIQENTVSNVRWGIRLNQDFKGNAYYTDTLITRNTITNTGGTSGDPAGMQIDLASGASNDIEITENILTGHATGVRVAGATATLFNNNVSSNTVNVDASVASPTVEASGNWWGVATPGGVAGSVGTNVDYTPWLDVGTDTSPDPGFQGDFSYLHVDDDSPQTGSTGRIQEAIDLVSGSTVMVHDGTYTEDLVVDEAGLTLRSENGKDQTTLNLVDGVGIDVQATATGFTLGGSVDQGFTINAGAATTFMVQVTNAPADVEISHNALDMTTGGGSASMGISVGAAGATGLTIDTNTIATASGDGAVWGPSLVDFTATGNTITGSGAYGIQVSGVTGTSSIDHNVVDGMTGSGAIVVSNGPGTSGLTISQNEVKNGTNGIRLVEYSPSTLGALSGVLIDDNDLTDNAKGLLIGESTYWGSGALTITDNSFSGNTDYQIRVEDADVLSGTDLYQIFDGTHATHTGNTFDTATVVTDGAGEVQSTSSLNIRPGIQQSIDDASSGQTVEVAAGTYNERITIGKPLTLLGAQAGVDARGRSASESTITEAGLSTPNPDVLVEVTAPADGTTIGGFTLIGDQTNTTADTSVVRAWADDVALQNNIIDGMYGLIYKGGDTLSVTHNTFDASKLGIAIQPGATSNVTVSDNTFALDTVHAVGGESAIYMTSVTGGAISDNVATGFVNGNGIGGSSNQGVDAAHPLLISGNDFSGNRKGVNFWGSTRYVELSGNTLHDNSKYGVNIKGQDISITGNTFDGNTAAAIGLDTHVMDTTGVTISGNAYANTTTGVEIENTGSYDITNVTITETIAGASTAAVLVAGTDTDVTVDGSTLTGNTAGVLLQAGGTATISATIFDGTTDNTTDVQLDAGAGAVTFGNDNQFAGDSFFIDNRSAEDLDLTTQTGTSFEGLSNNFRIEDKMYHKVDDLANGLTRWVAGNLYVTDAGTDHSIQRGIDAATAGDTVNVEAGSYTEDVDVSQAVTLAGEPTINGTLTVSAAGAVLSPGFSPGEMASGDLDLQNGTTFSVDIAGTTPGTGHDQVDVTGTVTLGATLSLNDTYDAQPGDEFILIDNDGSDAVTGTFAALAEGAILDAGDGWSDDDTARITYIGGDGNDVAIAVDGPAVFDAPDNGSADHYTVKRVGDNLQLIDTDGTTVLMSRPLAGLTTLTVNGEDDQDDTLTVDATGFGNDFTGTIVFNGGHVAGNDDLEITGAGSFGSVEHSFTNAHDGGVTIDADGGGAGSPFAVEYTGLEPVDDNLDAADRVFTFTGGAETITLTDAAAPGFMTIDSTLGESVTFANPTSSLTINAGTGDDTVTITSVDAAFDASLTIDGNDATDTVNLNAALTIDSDSVAVTAETINVTAAITTTTTGDITLDADTLVDLDASLTAAGALTIQNAAEIDLGAGVSLSAQGGNVDLDNSVTLIDLSGTGGANVITAAGSVEMAAVSDTGTPAELEINADDSVTLASVTLDGAANPVLDIDVDENGGGAALAAGALSAGTITVDGTSADDTFNFNGTVTSTAGEISINQASQVNFAVGADVTAQTSLKIENATTVDLAANVDLKRRTSI